WLRVWDRRSRNFKRPKTKSVTNCIQLEKRIKLKLNQMSAHPRQPFHGLRIRQAFLPAKRGETIRPLPPEIGPNTSSHPIIRRLFDVATQSLLGPTTSSFACAVSTHVRAEPS